MQCIVTAVIILYNKLIFYSYPDMMTKKSCPTSPNKRISTVLKLKLLISICVLDKHRTHFVCYKFIALFIAQTKNCQNYYLQVSEHFSFFSCIFCNLI